MSDYITESDLRAFIKDSTDLDSASIQAAITTASRSIDQMCKRRFYKDTVPSPKYFAPCSIFECVLTDTDGQHWDLYDTAGLQVATDNDGDGNYATSLTLNTHYFLTPMNGQKNGIAGWPYDTIHLLANGGQAFLGQIAGYRPTVQVTGLWGWTAVPDAVAFATKLAANRYFGRSDSRYGTQGFDAAGFAMRIRSDPDINALLAPFVDQSALVA